MDYFPVFLDAKKLNVLIVGGGNIAARKLELMLKTCANIELVALDFCERVQQLIDKHQLSTVQAAFEEEHLNGKNLVIAATDIEAVNQAVYQGCKKAGILANVVDNPELCGYITPAIIDRDPMLVAISSSGSSPVLVRILREQFEKLMPDSLGKLANFTFEQRERVQHELANVAERRAFWEQVLTSKLSEQLVAGDKELAEQTFDAALANWQQAKNGSITVIDVGDGNPDNLTLAAHRQLQFADCVYFDTSLNMQLIDYVRRDADKVETDSRLASFEAALSDFAKQRQSEQIIILTKGNQHSDKSQLEQAFPTLKRLDCRWYYSGSRSGS